MLKDDLLPSNKTEHRCSVTKVPGQRSDSCYLTFNNQDLQHCSDIYRPEETSKFSGTARRQDYQIGGCVRRQQYRSIGHHSLHNTSNTGFSVSRFGYVSHHTSLASDSYKTVPETVISESRLSNNSRDETKPTSTKSTAYLSGDNETNTSQSVELWYRAGLKHNVDEGKKILDHTSTTMEKLPEYFRNATNESEGGLDNITEYNLTDSRLPDFYVLQRTNSLLTTIKPPVPNIHEKTDKYQKRGPENSRGRTHDLTRISLPAIVSYDLSAAPEVSPKMPITEIDLSSLQEKSIAGDFCFVSSAINATVNSVTTLTVPGLCGSSASKYSIAPSSNIVSSRVADASLLSIKSTSRLSASPTIPDIPLSVNSVVLETSPCSDLTCKNEHSGSNSPVSLFLSPGIPDKPQVLHEQHQECFSCVLSDNKTINRITTNTQHSVNGDDSATNRKVFNPLSFFSTENSTNDLKEDDNEYNIFDDIL